MTTLRCFAPLALLAGAGACTLTADDYTPANAQPETPSTSSTEQTAPEGDGDPRTSAAPERPSVSALDGNGEASDSASTTERDAGTADAGPPPRPMLPELVGWASVAGLGLDTTTGGGDSPPLLARTTEDLRELAARPEPLTIAIAGTLDVGRLDLASNKTLFGIDEDATLRGGIAIRGSSDTPIRNVIVHNLNIDAASSTLQGDGIEIRYGHHVWVDHCELRDAADGLLDIVRASDFVTVSRTRFRYTAAAPDPTHRFAALVGHLASNADEDEGRLNVTWHHNWWSDDVARALLGRFGNIHLFNNLFSSEGNERVLDADVGANVLLENNVFANVTSPHVIILDSAATLQATGNVYANSTGPRDVAGTAFVPPYAYELESAIGPLITADVGPR